VQTARRGRTVSLPSRKVSASRATIGSSTLPSRRFRRAGSVIDLADCLYSYANTGTTFGTITIDGKTYEHDVIIRLSGEVVKRKRKLSKKYYGTSHVVSKDEAKFIFERGCEQLVLGSGQEGNVQLSPEAEAYFAKKGCKVLLQATPEAIEVFNRSHRKKIGLFHVTC
jgi:hypothetical protein